MTDGFTVISVYTVEQAIEDGVLNEVTDVAKEAGFRCRVFVTSELFADLTPSKEVKKKFGVDFNGRLWDLVWMASRAAIKNRNTNMVKFQFFLQTEPKFSPLHRCHIKEVLMTIDGNGITLMYPREY